MKRICALITAISFVIFAVPKKSVLAANHPLCVNMSFDNYVTNEVPDNIDIKGGPYYISNYQKNDKGLLIHTNKGSNILTIPATVQDSMTISFDITKTENASITGDVKIYDGVKFSPVLNFMPQGTVALYDGNEVGGVAKGKMTNIAICIDFATRCCNIYINGEMKYGNYFMKNMNLTKITDVGFTFKKGDGAVILDNINIHAGMSPYKNYPRATFLDEEVMAPDIKDEQNRVIFNSDFDTLNDLIWVSKDNLTIVTTEEDGNKCLMVEKTNSNDGYARAKISSNEYSDIIWEMDIKNLDAESSFDLCSVASVTRKWSMDVRMKNGIITAGGSEIARPNANTWTNIALAYHMENEKYDVYVDKRMVLSDVSMSSIKEEITDFNISIPSGEKVTKVLLDNVRCYEGTEPREFEKLDYSQIYNEKSPIDNDEVYVKMLGDNVIMHIKSGVIYANGKKTITDVLPYIKNNRTMVPIRAISEAFGIAIDYDNELHRIYIGDEAILTINSDVMIVNDTEIILDAAPEIYNGRAFLPMRAFCENVLGKKVVFNNSAETNSEIIVIGNDEFKMPSNKSQIQQLANFAFYYRPSKNEIYEIYKRNNSADTHPRIMINKDGVQKLKLEVKQNSLFRNISNDIISSADKYIGSVPPKYGLYDGTRMDSSPGSRNYTLGMAYLLTGDKKYAEEAWKTIEAVCAFPDWNPNHFLDTAEITAGIAVGYDWMYDAWTDEQKKVMQEALYEKGLFESALWAHDIKGALDKWHTSTTNWNAVCNGNLIIASLALMEVYPELCCDVISNGLRGLESFMAMFAPNGAYSEGLSYWKYLMPYLARMGSSLDSVLGTDFNFFLTEGFEQTMYFYLMGQSEQGTFNYGDATVETASYPSSLLWLSRKFNDPGIAGVVLNKTGGNLKGVDSLLFVDTAVGSDSIDAELDYWGKGADMVAMRENWEDSNASFIAYHGGAHSYNSIHSHNHLDGGSFVFDAIGERWAMDLGKDDYNITGYWNLDPAKAQNYRWQIFRMRAEAHNTIVINPNSTGVDHVIDSTAPIINLKSKNRGAISMVDLSYNLAENANSARRGFYLTDNRKALVVRDEIELKKQSDVYWHMYTEAACVEYGNDYAILQRNGKKLRLDFVSNFPLEIDYGPAKAIDGTPVVEGESKNQGIFRIRVKAVASGNFTLTAKLTPEGINSSKVTSYDINMDNWVIPEGELKTPPTIDMIFKDGEPIEGFSKYKKTYEIKYIEGETKVPTFTAYAEDKYVDIQTDGTYNNAVIIKVTDPIDEHNFSLYSIEYKKVPKPIEFNDFITFSPIGVTASEEPQAENPKEAAIDGNLNTRWSAEGKGGQWIEIDLGIEREVDTLFMATYSGNTRAAIFDVGLSIDGINYELVFEGQTSGTSSDLEEFKFPKTKARYVRITGYGNTSVSSSTWNSISEILIAVKK